MKKVMFMLLFFIIMKLSVFSQGKANVTGYVIDEKNGEAIIGASLYIKEIKRGAVTNVSGYFVIPDVPNGQYVLNVTCVGYEKLSKKIIITSTNRNLEKIYLKTTAYQTKEIVVKGDSSRVAEQLYTKSLSVVELSPAQINKIPQFVESDLLRSLQTLPGIVTSSDFSSALYVRGGTPDQNLYLIDGTDVYNPEHAFGFFSTFNTDAIKKVEMYKGGFGAEYGGRLSSVLNVTNIDGNRNNFQGIVNVSLLSAKMTLQSPLGDFGSISGSFRRTYLDQTIAKMVDDIPDYYFYDGNLKAFLDLSNTDKLSISFYGGKDNLVYSFDKDKSDSPELNYNWGNRTLSVNYRKILSEKLFANLWFTYSNFNSRFKFDEVEVNEKNDIDDVTLKANLEYSLQDNLSFKIGLENKYLYCGYKEDFRSGLIDFAGHRNDFNVYLSTNWKPVESVETEIGARFQDFNSDKNFTSIDPRFSLKYKADETTTLKFAAGRFSQYMTKIPRGFMVGIWTTADKNISGSHSNHYILGLAKEIANVYSLEVESYYKTYEDVPVFNQLLAVDIDKSSDDASGRPVYSSLKGILNSSKAKSYGAEILIRKDAGNITGWLSYSYSRTDNKVNTVNDEKWFIPRHDRTHNFNATVNMDLYNYWDELVGNAKQEYSGKWYIGINFNYSTGQTITYASSYYFARETPDLPSNRFLYPSEINEYRLPYYMRMDLSITYEKNYGSWTLSPYLQIFNVGNRKNVWFENYEYEDHDGNFENKIKTFNQIPFLPTFGVTVRF